MPFPLRGIYLTGYRTSVCLFPMELRFQTVWLDRLSSPCAPIFFPSGRRRRPIQKSRPETLTIPAGPDAGILSPVARARMKRRHSTSSSRLTSKHDRRQCRAALIVSNKTLALRVRSTLPCPGRCPATNSQTSAFPWAREVGVTQIFA